MIGMASLKTTDPTERFWREFLDLVDRHGVVAEADLTVVAEDRKRWRGEYRRSVRGRGCGRKWRRRLTDEQRYMVRRMVPAEVAVGTAARLLCVDPKTIYLARKGEP